LDIKTAQQVHSAKSEASKAKTGEQGSSLMVCVLWACGILLLFRLQKTSQAMAFKERISQRISGMVGRRNEKVRPLLKNDRMVGA